MSANSQPDGLPSCSQQSSGGVNGPFWRQAPVAIREHSVLLTSCRIALERSSTQHGALLGAGTLSTHLCVDRQCDSLRSASLDVADCI